MACKTGHRRPGCQRPRPGHFGRAILAAERYIRAMRPARRFIKTEIVLPESALGRAAVIGGLVVGGTVAMAMVTLFAVFVLETLRAHG